jgi:Protein of unknown function (Hypoth_ymh)
MDQISSLFRRSANFDVDDGLWEHVRASADAGHWSQAAANAAIFFESQVRRWGGFSSETFGRDLMSAAFHPENGPLRLSAVASEAQGWQQLAMGLAGVGNVDRHDVQERDDLKRYALGLIGTASLILTQIRHQHPDRVAT